MKGDHFSDQAKAYAKYRPSYPIELYASIYKHCNNFDLAWDCGCGNGQASIVLAEKFDKIEATDISEKQLSNAQAHSKVNYRKCPAESSGLADNSVDLVTVGQALHWFRWKEFFQEVSRVCKPNAFFAAWTYRLTEVSPEVDDVVMKFYNGVLNGYWPEERKYVDGGYVDIPFPFERVEIPNISMELSLTAEDFLGYLSTWSAVARYKKANATDPLDQIREEMKAAWGNDARTAKWPIVMLAGRVGYSAV